MQRGHIPPRHIGFCNYSTVIVITSLRTGGLNRPLFAGDPEVRILGYGKEQMWQQIFT